MKVVVVTIGRFAYVKGAEDAVRRWSSAGDTVSVVSLRKLDPVDWPIEASVDLGQPRTLKRLGRVGAALSRIWPGSVGRQLASKIRGSKQARALLDGADLVCGVEPVTAQALYRSSRRNPDAPHIMGLEPALSYSQR